MNFNTDSGGFQQGPPPDFSAFQRPRQPRKPRKPIGNAATRTLLNIVVTLAFALAYFYVELPAINLQNEGFYAFAFLCCAVYCGSAIFTSGFQGTGDAGVLSGLLEGLDDLLVGLIPADSLADQGLEVCLLLLCDLVFRHGFLSFFSDLSHQTTTRLEGARYISSDFFTPKVAYHSGKFLGGMLQRR